MRRIAKSFLPLIIILILLLTQTAQAAPNKVIVRAIRDGKAEFSKDKGKTWKRAKTGTVLLTSYSIRTDDSAMVDLFLGDNGPVVRLTKATELTLDRLD